MKSNAKTQIWHYLRMIIGTAAYAAGYSFFLHQNGMITGGVTGIATVINYLFNLPVGVLVIVINIPIFIWGGKKLGRRFLIDSALGTVLMSVFIDLFNCFEISLTAEPLLAAIYGGAICGAGLGIVFTTGATTGGTDIIARLLRMKFQYINIGQLVLILDAAIIIIYAVVFKSIELAMYSVILIIISSWLMDQVLYGLNYGKIAFIISDEYEIISRAINEEMDRGVTVLSGKGAYTHSDKNVLMCAMNRRQIPELKKIVRGSDPKAFIIISDTKEVLGKGFGKNETEG